MPDIMDGIQQRQGIVAGELLRKQLKKEIWHICLFSKSGLMQNGESQLIHRCYTSVPAREVVTSSEAILPHVCHSTNCAAVTHMIL